MTSRGLRKCWVTPFINHMDSSDVTPVDRRCCLAATILQNNKPRQARSLRSPQFKTVSASQAVRLPRTQKGDV
jgi:hypothetical protein